MKPEIIIASIIAIAAVYLFYKNIKKSASGKCNGCPGKSESCSCGGIEPDKREKK